MLDTCGGSDESALPVHPTLRCMGVRGGTPQITGGFFTHLFKLHLRTSSCRHRDCAGLPSGSLRLGLYTTVGHGRRPHAWGWCQGRGEGGGFFYALPGLGSSRHQGFWATEAQVPFREPLSAILKADLFFTHGF